MYEKFYGFSSKPFSLLPDPDFLWLGGKHQMALSMLEYGLVNQAGFVVITGEPGTGKTTLLNKLLAEHQRRFVVGTVSNTPSDLDALMPWILLAFNLTQPVQDRVQAYQVFSNFLREQHARHHRVLLVVDEAQNLGAQLLEELRLLSNLNDSKTQLLQIILSGQPDLRTLLQRPDLKQFAQRIAVDYNLAPLSEEEIPIYIKHRITVAGSDRPAFTERACKVIHCLSGGIPRLVNQVCDATLAYGFAEQAPFITSRIAANAGLDRGKGGLLPAFKEADILAVAENSQYSDVPSAVSANEQATSSNGMVATNGAGAGNGTAAKVAPRNGVPETAASAPKAPAYAPASDDPDVIYEEGMALRKEGHYPESIARFRLLTGHPSYALQAYAQIGICLRGSNKLAEAVVAFRKALGTQAAQLDQRTINVHYLLGRTLEDLDRMSEAVSAYRRVQRLDPSYKDVAARLDSLANGGHGLKNGNGGGWMEDAVQALHRALGGS